MDWGNPFSWLVDQLVTILKNFGLWLFDQILSMVDVVLSSFPSTFFDGLQPLSSVPADILGVFGALGGWTCLGILASAYVLRIPLGFFLR